MPAISRDGHRLAYGRSGVFNMNIWQVALEAPTRAGRGARAVGLIEPDSVESGVLARWPPAGVRVQPVGNA